MLVPAVEILVIGNEVLAGHVLDTNSHWLCQQLASHGARARASPCCPTSPQPSPRGCSPRWPGARR